MKRSIPIRLGIAAMTLSFLSTVHAGTMPPGQIDLSKFVPPGGAGELVEVNLGSTLISLAASFIQKQEPDIAKLLGGLHSVRVNVIGVNEQNQAELGKRSQLLRDELQGQGWERIVSAKEKDQDVGIYLKTENKDTIQGLVVVVLDGNREAVFVNVVGNIKPEQLSVIADKLHLDPLKKIGHATDKPDTKAAEQPEK